MHFSIHVCIYYYHKMTVEPRPYTCDAQEDVYLLLNVPHLVQQMVHAVLWSSGRK